MLAQALKFAQPAAGGEDGSGSGALADASEYVMSYHVIIRHVIRYLHLHT